jgi:hypothetical protein
MFNVRHIPENRFSRSPQRYQPRDPLQNDERPLPIGWERRISNNVDPSRVYYTNGRQSQWNFPNQEAEYQARIELEEREERQRAQAVERRARHRIQRAQGVERRAQEVERRALMARVLAEVRRNRRIGLNLQEHLELLTSNNHFNDYNRGIVLGTLRQFILNDNMEPTNNPVSVRVYIEDLQHLIDFLENPVVHSDLKFLCERIFEEMYKKLAEEKKLIDSGHTTHNARDTAEINFHLNVLNSIYREFRYIIPQ